MLFYAIPSGVDEHVVNFLCKHPIDAVCFMCDLTGGGLERAKSIVERYREKTGKTLTAIYTDHIKPN